jgi:IS5 family transposase
MSGSFFSIGAQARLGKSNHLLKLNELINWDRIALHLKGLHKNEVNPQGGPIAYDVLKMFKAILLGQWHNLSDPALEESLRIRVDFMLFTGLDINDALPDETTFCRFRNKLIGLNILDTLLAEINRQLEDVGLKVKNCDGAIVDAMVIESSARPRKVVETVAEDRKENDTDTCDHTVSYSHDSDARWLCKGKKYHYGYKGFIKTDAADGYIEHAHVTPANISEVGQLERLLEADRGKRVFADKGYASETNRKLLRDKGLKDGVMHRASRGNPLSLWQLMKNKLISKVRYKVERAFGTLKRKFGMGRARYCGLSKVHAELCLKAICFNLNKALRKVQAV